MKRLAALAAFKPSMFFKDRADADFLRRYTRLISADVTEEELSAALEEGTFSLAGIEIRALGNDAECFLRQWSSTGGENVSRYANSAYDTLLSVIAGAEDEAARLGCLHDAEAMLLEDAALAPLYTTVTAWTLRDSLTGVLRDGRGWFDFSGVKTQNG